MQPRGGFMSIPHGSPSAWTSGMTPATASLSTSLACEARVGVYASIGEPMPGTQGGQAMQPTDATAQYDMPRVEKSPQVGAPRAEISRTPYQQYVWNSTLDEQFTSKIDFDVVPANSRLEITNVSCHLNVSSELIRLLATQLLVIGTDGTIVTASTLTPTILFPGQNVHIWTVNHTVCVFADA